jgi:NADH-quinone oxidoreductase subunit N
MNAIIFSAIWGVVMMFSGVFIKSKSTPKYLAIAGILLIFITNAIELNSGVSLFKFDVHDMLRTGSFNLTFIAVAAGATLIYFLLSGSDIERVGPHVGEYFALIFFVFLWCNTGSHFQYLAVAFSWY